MEKVKERLELFRQIAGKVVITAPVLKVPSRGYQGSEVREYYR